MEPIRVMIVDDSVVMRRLLATALAEDPEIDVAGVAASGPIALARIPQVRPDVVTLDVEMGEMSGLETLAELRRRHPTLPVIMFSTLTEAGAQTTLDALSLGASDYVAKPTSMGSLDASTRRVKDELLPRIKALTGRSTAFPTPAVTGSPRARSAAARTAAPVDAVVVGVSTGGPAALAQLVTGLPSDLSVPVLVVQHMPPLFTRLLAERLDRLCPLSVAEAADGTPVEPGRLLIAPGDTHLVVERGRAGVIARHHDGPAENSCRPSVDVLFRSAIRTWGPHLLAVVMTGMGQDGLRGCEEIRDAGGQVVVQDRATSVVWGMPGLVADAGLADAVVALPELANALVRRVRAGAQPAQSAQPTLGVAVGEG